MLVKVSELTGAALDWAVAKCEFGVKHLRIIGGAVFLKNCDDLIPCNFATDWSQGGPIIDREKIKIDPRKNQWEATIWNEPSIQNPTYGPTALIAAMRCYVASKSGDEVEIPDQLK